MPTPCDREPMNVAQSPNSPMLQPAWPDTPLSDEQWGLFAASRDLATKLARRWSRFFGRPDLEETFLDETYAAALAAARSFDRRRGGTFGAGLEMRLKTAYGRCKAIRDRTSGQFAGVALASGDDPLATIEAPPDREVQGGGWMKLLADLPEVQAEALVAFHLEGEPIASIARRRGVRSHTIRDAVHRVGRRLKRPA